MSEFARSNEDDECGESKPRDCLARRPVSDLLDKTNWKLKIIYDVKGEKCSMT